VLFLGDERTFLVRVKEDTYIKMLELQKYLRFQETQDRRRKTMDYVIKYLLKQHEQNKKR
jgi:hypothetical protein